MAKIAFKSDNQKEILLFPPSLEEKIPATHHVRVVDAVIESLNVDTILSSYRGGGNSCFHPRQMLRLVCTDPKNLDRLLNRFIGKEFGIVPDSFRLILV